MESLTAIFLIPKNIQSWVPTSLQLYSCIISKSLEVIHIQEQDKGFQCIIRNPGGNEALNSFKTGEVSFTQEENCRENRIRPVSNLHLLWI